MQQHINLVEYVCSQVLTACYHLRLEMRERVVTGAKQAESVSLMCSFPLHHQPKTNFVQPRCRLLATVHRPPRVPRVRYYIFPLDCRGRSRRRCVAGPGQNISVLGLGSDGWPLTEQPSLPQWGLRPTAGTANNTGAVLAIINNTGNTDWELH